MEDFRGKVQRFFSNTAVVIIAAILTFAGIMVLFNFAGTLAANQFQHLKSVLKAGRMSGNGIIWPNPFCFDFYKFKWWYLFSGFLAVAFSGRLAYLMKLNMTPLSKSQLKGSRHFASVKGLNNEFRSVPEKKEKFKGSGGFPISRYKDRIFIDDSPVNNLIIGTSRSGKTQIEVIPAIDIYSRAEKQASMIIADPKGELSAASKATLEKRGYTVLIFDLMNFVGLSYNPLQLVLEAYLRGNKPEAQLLANTFSYILFHDPTAKDKSWENWSIALTNALILAVVIDCCAEADKCEKEEDKQKWYGKINMYSVARLLVDLGEMDENGKSPLDNFFLNRSLNDIARIQYASVAFAGGKTKGNIFSEALSQLIKFTMEPIAKMTSKNTISLEKIGFDKNKPTAVFLILPDYDTSNHFLATIFISQLYYVLSKKCSVTNGKCPREVVFILDEFGNITPIPDIAHILSVCLGRNIRFDLIIQAYSQIYQLYGQQDGKTILSQCGNQIYILTIEQDTAKQFSSLIGNKTVTEISRNERKNFSFDKHISERPDMKPLLNPNELMELEPGESVVVRVTKRNDLKGRNIRPSPIFNHGKTAMKYSYEYLTDDFSGSCLQSADLSESCLHRDVNLDENLYSPFVEKAAEKVVVEKPLPFDPPLKNMLTKSKKEQIKKFLSLDGFAPDSIDFSMTVTQFDCFLQELLDKGKISQQAFDDIYTVLDGGRERSETFEI